jgi:hypothetical protein
MKPFDLFSILYQELWPTLFSKSMSEGVLDFLTFLTEECVNAFSSKDVMQSAYMQGGNLGLGLSS